MTCKGVCCRYRATKPKTGIGRYQSGQKRCQICEEYVNWEGYNCPCCGYKLRTKPRGMKVKAIHGQEC